MAWKPLKSPEDIRDLLTAYQPAAVVTTAFAMGIFAIIASDGPQTADEISNTCEAHPQSFALLLNACVSLGLLTFDMATATYDLSELAQRTLVTPGPEYLGNFMRLQNDIQSRWEKLSDGITYNQRVNAEKRAREDGSAREWNRQFILGLHDSARTNALQVAEVLAPVLASKNITSLLDVGCGSGAYSMALLAQMPQLNLTLYDLTGVLAVTRELVERFASENPSVTRPNLLPGDFHEDNLGEPATYEAALLFGVLHSETQQGQIELLGKIGQVLRPGGLLIIRGPLLNRDKTTPLNDTFAALQTLLSTDNGEVLSLDELRQLLSKCGFGHVTTLKIKNSSQRLVSATKNV